MATRTKSDDPEIFCDFNARVTERGYWPTLGTKEDLAKLGLTLGGAVGRRFVFVSGDADEHGTPDDIMCNGIVARDDRGDIVLEIDGDFYHRSELREDTP